MAKPVGFTDKDEKTVELLIAANVPKNIAKALVFLTKKEEAISQEIEATTGLRQPEVSLAMQEMRSQGWVTKRDIKKEGKGRPVHAYKLAKPLSEIIGKIESDQKKRIEDIQSNMARLSELLGIG